MATCPKCKKEINQLDTVAQFEGWVPGWLDKGSSEIETDIIGDMDWEKTGKFDDFTCPECGEVILTHPKGSTSLKKAIDFLNGSSPTQQDNVGFPTV